MQPKKSKLKTALVLSGGGARGAFEVGVLKELEKKIIPDVIIATSVGSINASLYTTGYTTKQLEEIWLSLSKKMLFPFNRQILYKLHLANSIADISSARRFLFKHVGRKTFDDTSIPLYVNATRLKDGKGVFFHHGLLVDAVTASAAVPPFYPPHIVKGERYIDGGISDYIGTEEALKLGCKQIIVVNLGYQGHPEHHKGFLNILSHTIDLLMYQGYVKEVEMLKRLKKKVIIIESPTHGNFSITDFSNTATLIKAGEEKAREQLHNIQM